MTRKQAGHKRPPIDPAPALPGPTGGIAREDKRAMGISLMCWRAKGTPMNLMARMPAETRWAMAISHPKRISQITFNTISRCPLASGASTS